MIRRSFRIGLTLGLLGGLAFALAKMFGARPDLLADQAPAAPEPWPPLQADLMRPTPPPVPVAPVVEPAAPVAVMTAPVVDEPVIEVAPARPLVAATGPAPLDGPSDEAVADEVAGKIAGKAALTPRSARKATTNKAATKTAATKKAAASKKAVAKRVIAKTAGAPKTAGATKKAAKKAVAVLAWVEPTGDVCPTSHPVKAKLSSKIFHLPGMLNYARTNPDRCYRDAAAAEADEMRPAKR